MKLDFLHRTFASSFFAAVLCFSKAQASLLLEQWQGGGAGFSGLAGADAAIAGRLADASGYYSIIDFTDDPGGFAGEIPGSVPWPLDPANDDFAARVSGLLSITTADTYYFRTYADDGVRLRVNGTTIIEDDTYHPEIPLVGSIFLGPGTYAIDLVFFEGGGEASLEFSMAQGSAEGPYGHVGNFEGTTTSAVPEASTWFAGAVLVGMFGAGRLCQRFRRR